MEQVSTQVSDTDWVETVPPDTQFMGMALGPLCAALLILLAVWQFYGVSLGYAMTLPVSLLLIMGLGFSFELGRASQWQLAVDADVGEVLLRGADGKVNRCSLEKTIVAPSGILIGDRFIQTRFGAGGFAPQYAESIWPKLSGNRRMTDAELLGHLLRRRHVRTWVHILFMIALCASVVPLLHVGFVRLP